MIVAWKIRNTGLRQSFGIPDYPNRHYTTRTERRYGLNLEVRLKNRKVKSFDFDVTDQVAVQPQGGLCGERYRDFRRGRYGRRFRIRCDDIKDWGEYEDIELLSKR